VSECILIPRRNFLFTGILWHRHQRTVIKGVGPAPTRESIAWQNIREAWFCSRR
jgi:hypothetical protein